MVQKISNLGKFSLEYITYFVDVSTFKKLRLSFLLAACQYLIRCLFLSQVIQESYSMPLPETIPGQSFSYSDHEAVMAKFKISRTITGKHLRFLQCSKLSTFISSVPYTAAYFFKSILFMCFLIMPMY